MCQDKNNIIPHKTVIFLLPPPALSAFKKAEKRRCYKYSPRQVSLAPPSLETLLATTDPHSVAPENQEKSRLLEISSEILKGIFKLPRNHHRCAQNLSRRLSE